MWIHPKIRALKTPEGERFMESLRLASTLQSTDCWRWPGAVNKHGYGIISLDLQPFTIHTVSFQLYKGAIGGFEVMHDCDYRRCWKPGHLFLGTHQENMQDMISKGRAGWQRKKIEAANMAQCQQVENFHPAYGKQGEIRPFRCVMQIGHEGDHFYNLMQDHEFHRRIYGPRLGPTLRNRK